MKIKVTEKPYAEVMKLTNPPLKPIKQRGLFRWLLKTLSMGDLKQTDFTYEQVGMEKLPKDQPALFLMNHSSFIDLEMASVMLYERQFHIVCTNDGFVGKNGLMRAIGCIPANKFVTDLKLVKDMAYCVNELKSSILMYPEASYSFDGTETPLPSSVGKCLKLLKVPVVMIRTKGAFLRDPLYNNLQKRAVKTKAVMTYLLSPEEIREKSVDELNKILAEAFTYDHFREQVEDNVLVTENFRADGLERVLYRCPCCEKEGQMQGKGIHLTCKACGHEWTLEETGKLSGGSFEFIPDWYRWERECTRKKVEDGTYHQETDVDIIILRDLKSVYKVGEGHLVHDTKGFTLTGCHGELNYSQKASASYSLYSDYFWYEIGDMVCIGDKDTRYYCFPKGEHVDVAKFRLAQEEMYQLGKKK